MKPHFKLFCKVLPNVSFAVFHRSCRGRRESSGKLPARAIAWIKEKRWHRKISWMWKLSKRILNCLLLWNIRKDSSDKIRHRNLFGAPEKVIDYDKQRTTDFGNFLISMSVDLKADVMVVKFQKWIKFNEFIECILYWKLLSYTKLHIINYSTNGDAMVPNYLRAVRY